MLGCSAGAQPVWGRAAGGVVGPRESMQLFASESELPASSLSLLAPHVHRGIETSRQQFQGCCRGKNFVASAHQRCKVCVCVWGVMLDRLRGRGGSRSLGAGTLPWKYIMHIICMYMCIICTCSGYSLARSLPRPPTPWEAGRGGDMHPWPWVKEATSFGNPMFSCFPYNASVVSTCPVF